MKILAKNRRVLRDFKILNTYEAGLVLTGAETKASKAGQINLKGSYISVSENNEVLLVGAHIGLYKKAIIPEYNPERNRKLLLHKKEIKSLLGKSKQKGLTLMPLKVYTKKGLVKVEIALVRGKKRWDKRQDIKQREAERRIAKALKNRR